MRTGVGRIKGFRHSRRRPQSINPFNRLRCASMSCTQDLTVTVQDNNRSRIDPEVLKNLLRDRLLNNYRV